MRIALKTSGAMVVGGEVEEFKQAVLRDEQKEFDFRVEFYWDMRFQGVYRSLHNNQAW